MKKVLLAIALIIAIVAGGLYYLNVDSKTFIKLSKADMLEEYEYLWQELRASYPFLSFVERSGIDINKVYEDNKAIIEKSKTDIDYLKNLLFLINDLGGAGHLSIITPKTYSTIYEPTYNELMKSDKDDIKEYMQPWIDTFYNEEVTKNYGLLDTSAKTFRTTKNLKKKDSDESNTPVDNVQTTKNLTVGFIEKGEIAYLKVDSFMFTNKLEDSETLDLFFNDIKDYKNLIIDIRDNTGGSDLYWKELLVAPNITETLSYTRYALLKMSDTVKPFINSRFSDSEIKPISELPQFENINTADIKEMTNFIESTNTVESLMKTKKFQGKIWLLTSSRNYSSSENFAMFCKETGFATLVGEVTNGDGGIMDPIIISLPKSKMLLNFSALYGLNSDGSCNEEHGTMPDYLIKYGENALTVCKQIISEK